MKALTQAGIARLMEIIGRELNRRGVNLLDDRAWFARVKEEILAPESEGVNWERVADPVDPDQLNLF